MNSKHFTQLMLQVMQQNPRKSLTAQLDFLAMTSTDKVDICLIQEPYINFLHLTSSTPHWTLLYLTCHSTHPQETRTITLISNKISSNSIHQIIVDSSDIIAISTDSEVGMIDIYNIYLDCKHSLALTPLMSAIASQCQTFVTPGWKPMRGNT